VGEFSYEVTAESKASPEAVFAVLADGSRWKEWAGAMIRHSSFEREGTPAPGGVGAIRRVGSWPLYGREEIVEYEPPTRLAYTILSGQPIRNYKAIVELAPRGGGTAIRWSATFDPKIPGTGRLFSRYFAALIGGFAKRLAERAERA